ncbi:HAD family hydrolase [Aquihabitans sp. G128]|uniref:HAD family hydrolase n=1 Tax=Aquihabitans sp. G128 TaxID=2849779 RepID=UPI001C23150A|nr:HAD family hydrolase [Aquihabitans sp. G128]QXC61556.1 HAD family hydrolase [Aquihabitans sp. G128]
MPRFDAIFLDAGGVLVCPQPERIVERFAAAGFDVDPDRLFEAHYRGVLAIDAAEAEPEVFGDYHQAYATHLGLVGDRQAAATAVLEGLWEQSGLWTQPLPWAAEALAALAATGIPIVVVSNADGTVADLLTASGLLQVGPGPGVEVAAIVDSGAVGVAKPDPAIFELALDLVGATADRAVHVGDAYQYDVRGARAAGVHPVLVDPLGVREAVDCDRIATLLDLLPLLA